MKATDRFKIAGKELIKGNIGNAFKSALGTLDPLTYRSSKDFWLFGAGEGGEDIHFSYSSLNDALKAYINCPPVSAIVQRKAQAHINGKTWVLNTQGKAKEKEANGEVATRLKTLMARPNALQSWTQFEAQMKSFLLLFGFCPILVVKPVGFDATYARSLWILPPWLLEIEESDVLFYTTKENLIKSIKITYRGRTSSIDPDFVFIVKDFSIGLDSMVIPESRIKSLSLPIKNVIGAYQSRHVLIKRRGALGILSNGGKDTIGQLPLDEEEKKRVQDELTRYGLMGNQWQVIVTSAALQWQQMGYPTKELMLFEEVEGSTMAISDRLGYEYRLLGQEKSASYNDINEAKKQLYIDHVIPEACNIYEQLNNLFELAKYNLKMEKDYSHLAILQEDEVKKTAARYNRARAMTIEFQNNVITLNEWRVANGDDPINEDWGQMYYFQLKEKGIVFGSANAGNSNSNSDNENENQGNDTNT